MEKPDPICEPCLAGRQTHAIHTKPATQSDELLYCVSADLHGPIHTQAVPNHLKYWMPIEDEASGYTHVTLLRTKGQAMEAFTWYKAMVETQTRSKIKHLQDDKGREFISTAFDNVCANAGIKREHTIQTTPEQNRTVEQTNRRLSKGATALLAEAKLPLSFWGFAVLAFAHVMNRCPS